MEKIIEFAVNNWLIFTIVSAVLLLALIGYLAENKKGKDVKVRVKKEKKPKKAKKSKKDEAPMMNPPGNLQ